MCDLSRHLFVLACILMSDMLERGSSYIFSVMFRWFRFSCGAISHGNVHRMAGWDLFHNLYWMILKSRVDFMHQNLILYFGLRRWKCANFCYWKAMRTDCSMLMYKGRAKTTVLTLRIDYRRYILAKNRFQSYERRINKKTYNTSQDTVVWS